MGDWQVSQPLLGIQKGKKLGENKLSGQGKVLQ